METEDGLKEIKLVNGEKILRKKLFNKRAIGINEFEPNKIVFASRYESGNELVIADLN